MFGSTSGSTPPSLSGGNVAIVSSLAPAAIGPYSQGIKAGGFIFLSGQIPLDPQTGEVVGNNVTEQTERVIQNIIGLLSSVGAGLSHIVKATVFLKDMNTFAEMNSVYSKHFVLTPPARSTIEVARLPKDVMVEIEVIAHQPKVDGGPGASVL